ncbi:hypothetical protein M404DRAFT_431524 [Pisolithus tinctorius Marx 270]|uniref:Uncharacterized protein n=1 Tax=Pisolithus tinctorius Marx 270 TaxID=870435 RepID=A0A0C3P2F0_PISTI|nr:hypothetical protein M404DRAFT_431524 [Pisolithus tinctorius Marx 270]
MMELSSTSLISVWLQHHCDEAHLMMSPSNDSSPSAFGSESRFPPFLYELLVFVQFPLSKELPDHVQELLIGGTATRWTDSWAFFAASPISFATGNCAEIRAPQQIMGLPPYLPLRRRVLAARRFGHLSSFAWNRGMPL